MWRSYLLTYPFLAIYVALVVPIFVPITWVTGSIRPIYWMARQGCRMAFLLSGIRVRVLNHERAFIHPCCVFVANHVSNLEAPALFSVLPRIAVIMKDSLGRLPLLGYAMRMGGFICVDRKAKDSRRKALDEAMRTLRAGISMLVFPEGTRNPAGQLLPFRPGPFQIAIGAGVPIVPVTVHDAKELMPRKATFLSPGVMTLAFHPPVPMAGVEDGDRRSVMAEVRATMQAALDSPPD